MKETSADSKAGGGFFLTEFNCSRSDCDGSWEITLMDALGVLRSLAGGFGGKNCEKRVFGTFYFCELFFIDVCSDETMTCKWL